MFFFVFRITISIMDTVNLTLFSKEYKDYLRKETRNTRKGFRCNVRGVMKETRKARRQRKRVENKMYNNLFGFDYKKLLEEVRKEEETRVKVTENSIKVDSLKTAVVTSMDNSTIPGMNFIPSGEKLTSLIEPCNDGKKL